MLHWRNAFEVIVCEIEDDQDTVFVESSSDDRETIVADPIVCNV